MPKYYIPLVMVIEAQNCKEACDFADTIEDALVELLPSRLDGFAELPNLEPCEAADEWNLMEEVYVTHGGKDFTLATKVS